MNNEMKLSFKAITENESFARVCVASFCSSLNPSIDVLADIKTAVSEAVTNCIVHAYPQSFGCGNVEINVQIIGNNITIAIKDYGIGIDDIEKARMPFYTSKPNSERSGIGFTVMEGFMDSVEVKSAKGCGTTVIMHKTIVQQGVQVGG